jgi:CO/xanthine dehydrogenase Mo-binding subunit
MNLTRRHFLAAAGTVGLAYVLGNGLSGSGLHRRLITGPEDFSRKGNRPGVDFRDWLMISSEGDVSVFTARTELGQGVTTVLYNLVCQALELPDARINVVMGDTDLCPGDGPTTGSSATRNVGWAFWVACHQVRRDLVLLAAEVLGEPPESLAYKSGEIINKDDGARRLGIGDLADGRVRRIALDQVTDRETPPYIDRKTLNVNADAIVTGTLKFAGDYYPQDCLYGGMLVPGYHDHLTDIQSADLERSKDVAGIEAVYEDHRTISAIGESFHAVQKALSAAEVTWKEPRQPRELMSLEQIRSGARLIKTVEFIGDAESALASADLVITETYRTQFASQVPLETPTAVVYPEGERMVVRVGTQNPFRDRYNVAKTLWTRQENVHVIAAACGGAFGAKTNLMVTRDAAKMARKMGKPIKIIYSRLADIQKLSRYKESVVVDISTGLSSSGKIVARTIDYYGDEGYGSLELYAMDHARTQLFEQTTMPVRHATIRGTSYSQNVFAIESHTDMVARAAGIEPLAFRRANVEFMKFRPVIDACSEMFGDRARRGNEGHGVGYAICNHGGRQLGAIAAEVRVDRQSGKINVLALAGAFDIGVVINVNTAVMGIKGSMIWGLGYALLEEVDLDGHLCRTTGFSNYRVPRMKDIPPIEVCFVNTVTPHQPRGCGEAPGPPTTAAIANAVFDAIGIRFYELPITPEKVLAALNGQTQKKDSVTSEA